MQSNAAEMTALTDSLRASNSPELLAALLVEQDAYLEAGDLDAAAEVAREIAEVGQ